MGETLSSFHFTLISTPSSVIAGAPSLLTVSATDSFGNLATSFLSPITFHSSDALSSSPALISPLSNGSSTFAFSLKTAGTQLIWALSETLSSSSSLSVKPASASSLSTLRASPNSNLLADGSSVSTLNIRLIDSFQNVLSGISPLLSSSDPSDTFSEAPPTDSTGSTSETLSATTAGVKTLSISSPSGISSISTSVSFAPYITDPSLSSLSSTSASLVADYSSSATLRVTLKNNVGLPLPNKSVSLSSNRGASDIITPLNSTTDNHGEALFSIKSSVSGTSLLSATVISDHVLLTQSTSINFIANSASQLVLSAPSSVVAGSPALLTVSAYDNYSNLASGYTGVIQFSSSDPQSVSPASSGNLSNGRGIFSFTLKTVNLQTLTITDNTPTGSLSSSITLFVTPAQASSLILTTPSFTTAGVASTLTLFAKDPYSNLATSFSGSLTFSSSDPQSLSPASVSSLPGGTGIIPFTLKTAPSQTITVSSEQLLTTSSPVTVNPSAADSLHSSLTATPSRYLFANGLSQSSISILLGDAFGNALSHTFVSLEVSGSGNSLGSLPLTDSSGKTSTTLSSTTAETKTLSISSPSGLTPFTTVIFEPSTGSTALSISTPTNGSTFYNDQNNQNFTVSGICNLSSAQFVFIQVDGASASGAGGSLGAACMGSAFSTTIDVTPLSEATHTLSALMADSQGNSITSSSLQFTKSISATQLLLSALPSTIIAGSAQSITVTALDAMSNIATNFTGLVNFSSNDPSPFVSLPPEYSFLPSELGVHSYPSALSLATAGTHSITASSSTLTPSSQSTLVLPASASTFILLTPSSVTAGSASILSLSAKDPYGNLATDYLSPITFSSSDPQSNPPAPLSTLPEGPTFPFTLKTAGSQIISAQSASFSISSLSITVYPALASDLSTLSASPPSGILADNSSLSTITLILKDSYNNLISGITPSLSSSDPSHDFFSPALPTDSSGLSSLTLRSQTPGLKTLSLSSPSGLSSVSTSVSFSDYSAAPELSTLSIDSSSLPADNFSTASITLTLKNNLGQLLPHKSVSLTTSRSSVDSISPSTSTTDSNGQAFFTLKSSVSGTSNLSAFVLSDQVLISQTLSVEFLSFDVAQLSIIVSPSLIAGSSGTLSVFALDSTSNLVSSYSGLVYFTSTDTQIDSPAPSARLSQGSGTFLFTLKTAGTQTISAFSENLNPATALVSVSPSSASTLIFASPSYFTAGLAGNLSISTRDPYSNPVTSFFGSITFSSSDSQSPIPASPLTLSNGSGVISVTLKTAPSQRISAKGDGISAITPDIPIHPSSPVDAYSSITASPADYLFANGLSPSQVTVLLRDAFQNGVSNTAVSVSVSGSGNTLDTFESTDASGSSQANLFSISAETKTLSISSPSGLSLSTTVIFKEASGINALSISSPPSVSTFYNDQNHDHFTVSGICNLSSNQSVYIYVDDQLASGSGGNYGSLCMGNLFSTTIDVSSLSEDTHSLTAVMADASLSSITSAPILLTKSISASQLLLSALPNSITAGSLQTLTLSAYDAIGNIATNFRGTVTFNSSDSSALAILPQLYSFSSLDSGSHIYSEELSLVTAGNQTLSAYSGSLFSNSLSTYVSPNSASTLSSLSASPHSGLLANHSSVSTLTLTLKDAYGNPISGVYPSFSSSGASSDTFSESSSSNSLGISYATLGSTSPGAKTISIISPSGLSSISTSVTFNPNIGSSSSSILSASSTSITADGLSTSTLRVSLMNTFGQPISGKSITLNSSRDLSDSITALSPITNSSGEAFFTIKSTIAGRSTLSATDLSDSIVITQTLSLSFTAGQATRLELITPSSMIAGSEQTLSVTAYDSVGNIATHYFGTLSFTSSDSQNPTPIGDSVLSQDGVGTFSFTLYTASTQSISVSSTSLSSASASILVSADSASQLILQAPSSVTAGEASNLTVLALDSYRNLATTDTQSVSFSSTDAQMLTPAPTQVFSQGSQIVSFTLRSAGNQNLSASISTSSASVYNIQVNPAQASSSTSSLGAYPTQFIPADGSSTSSISLTLKDAFYNTVTNTAVSLSISGRGNSLSSPSRTSSTGSTSASLKSTVAETKTLTILSPSGLTNSLTIQFVSANSSDYLSLSSPLNGAIIYNSTNSTTYNVSGLCSANNNQSIFIQIDGAPAGGLGGAGVQCISPSFQTTIDVSVMNEGSHILSAWMMSDDGNTNYSASIQLYKSISASQLSLTGLPTSLTAGTPQTLTLSALDAAGNIATQFSGSVTFSSSDTAASFPVAFTFSNSDAGIKIWDSSFTLYTAGSQSFKISSPPYPSVSQSTSVLPASVSTFLISTPSSMTAGNSSWLSLKAQDDYGNLVSSISDTITFSSTDFLMMQPASDLTLTNGTGSTFFTLKTAGSQRIIASSSTASNFSPYINVTSSSASSESSLSADPEDGILGDGSSLSTITIELLDEFQNAMSNIAPTLSSPYSDLTITQSGMTASDGLAYATVQSSSAGVKTLNISSPGGISTIITTVSFSPNIGDASQSSLLSDISSLYADGLSSATLTLTLLNIDGLALSNKSVTLNSSRGSQDSITASSSLTDSNGQMTFIVSSTRSGIATFTATDNSDSIIVLQTVNLTFNPGSATQLALYAPSSVTAGSSSTLTVASLDLYGNIATDFYGSISFSSTDPLSLVPANTFPLTQNGIGSFSFLLYSASSQSITAMSEGLTSATSTLKVIPASATQLSLKAPSNLSAGKSYNLTITALDPYLNTATNFKTTITLSSSDPQSSSPATNTSLTNGSRIFDFTLKTAGSQNITATSATLKTTLSPLSVTPASASSTYTTLNAYPSNFIFSNGSAISSIAIVLRDPYNNFISNTAVSLSVSGLSNTLTQPALTDSNGSTYGKISTTNAESKTLSISSPSGLSNSMIIQFDPTASLATLNVTTPSNGTIFYNNQNNSQFTISGSCSSNTNAIIHMYVDGSLASGNGGSNGAVCSGPTSGVFSTTINVSSLSEATHTLRAVMPDDLSNLITFSLQITKSISAKKLLLSPLPSSITAGSSQSMTVSALDGGNNLATQFRGSVLISSSDFSAKLPSSYTFSALDAGSHSYSNALTLFSIGTQSLSASSSSLISSSQSTTVTPAAASTLLFSAPSSLTAGSAQLLSLSAEDSYGNIVSNYLTPITFSSNDTQSLTPAPSTTLSSGTRVVSFSLKTAGSWSLSSKSGSLSSTLTSITVSPSSASTLSSLKASPSSNVYADASSSSTLSITLKDAFGNAISYVTPSLSVSGGSSNFLSLPSYTNSSGATTATLKSSSSGVKTVSLAYPSGLSSLSTSITFIEKASSSQSSISTSSTTLLSDGAAMATITVSIKNASGTPLSGKVVSLSSSRGSSVDTLATSPATTNASGIATFTLKSSTSGTATLSASVDTLTLRLNQAFSSNLSAAYYAAEDFDGTHPGSNSSSTKATWVNTISPGTYNGSLNKFSFTSSSGWTGTGTQTNPYQLAFLSSNSNFVNFTSDLNNGTNFSFETVAKLASPSTRGSVILSNGDPSGKGITLRQAKDGSSRLELLMGNSSSYEDVILADKPNLYYRLGDNSASSFSDSSGSGQPGVGSSTGLTPAIGGALSNDSNTSVAFNGSSGYIYASGYVFPAMPSSTNQSFEVWFKTTAIGQSVVYTSSDLYSPGGVSLHFSQTIAISNGGNLMGEFYTGPTHMPATRKVNDGKWHYAALTVAPTAGLQVLYLDGASVGSLSHSLYAEWTPNVYLGITGNQHGWGPFFNGSIQDFAIYNKVLSASDILRHYNARTLSLCTSESTFSANSFYFLSGVYNNASQSLSLYSNGNLECSVSTPNTFATSTYPLAAGANTSGSTSSNYFSGAMSDLWTYNSALSGSNISSDYSSASSNTTLAPSVLITSPTSGSAIASTSSQIVSGKCSSSSAATVKIYVDGALASGAGGSTGTSCTNNSFSTTMNTTSLAIGYHYLQAKMTSGSTTVNSSLVGVSRGTLSLSLSAPSSVTAGVGSTLTLRATDSFGNLAQSYSGNITFSSSDPQAPSPAPIGTLTNGSGVFTFTLKTAGSITINASSSSLSTASASVSVKASSLSTLSTLSASPSTVYADNYNTSSITITLKDAYNNLISGITPSFTSSGGSSDTLKQPSASNSSGISTGTIKSSSLGTRTLSLSYPSGLTSVTDTITFVTPSVFSTSLSSVSLSPRSLPADSYSQATLTVKIFDTSNNAVSGKGVSVTSSRSNYDTIDSSSVITNSSGNAVFKITSNKSGVSTFTTIVDTTTWTNTLTFTNGTPILSITTPEPSLVLNSSSNYTAFSLGGLCSANGQTVTFYAKDGVSTPSSGTSVCSSNTWGGTLDLSTLTDATLTFSATMQDLNGNTATAPGGMKPLSSAWTPAYSNLANYWQLRGIGPIESGISGIVPDKIGGMDLVSANLNDTGLSFYTSPVNGLSGITFDGVDDGLVSQAFQSTISGNYTVSLWLTPYSLSSTGVFPFSTRSGAALTQYTFQLAIKDAGLMTSLGDGTSWLSTGAGLSYTFSNNSLYHIVYSVTPSAYTIYVNGTTQATRSLSGTPMLYGPTNPLSLGSFTYPFTGKIHEVALWNTNLSDAQVQSVYNTQLPAPYVLTATKKVTPPNLTFTSSSFYANASNYTSFTTTGVCKYAGQTTSPVIVNVDGVPANLASGGTCSSGSSGTFMVVLNMSPYSDGTHTLFATLTDNVGNIATSNTRVITEGKSAPTLTITQPTLSSTINASNVSNFTIGGTCSLNGQALTFSAQDGSLNTVSKAVTCSSGAWSSTLNLSSLTDSTLSFFAVIRDSAMNTVTSRGTSSNNGLNVNLAPAYSNLAGYWNFNGTGSLSANSIVSAKIGSSDMNLKVNNSNGTGAAYKTGKFGNAITFDGLDDFLTSSSTSTISGNYTVSFWTSEPNFSTLRGLFGSRTGTPYGMDIELSSASLIYGNIGNGSTWLSTTADSTASFTLSPNTWNHLVYSVATTGYSIYLNGSSVGSGSYSGTPLLFNSTNYFTVGYTIASQAPALGLIDELAIWNTNLSAAQVKSLYNNQVSSDLVLVKDTIAPTITLNLSNSLINASNVSSFTLSGNCTGANQTNLAITFLVDGLSVTPTSPSTCSSPSSGTYTASLDMSPYADTTHTFQTKITDPYGNSATSLTQTATKNSKMTSLSSTLPSSTSAGSPITLTLSAIDDYGNRVTTYSNTLTFSSTDPRLPSPASNLLMTQGSASVTFTLKTTGSQTISASFTDQSFSTSSSIFVNPGAASTLFSSLSAKPSSAVRADNSSLATLSITLADNFNNFITGVTPSISNPNLSFITLSQFAPTDSSGNSSATLKSKIGGTQTFSISSPSSLAGFENASITFIASFADDTYSTISVNPAVITANGSSHSTINVSLYDAGNNLITSGVNVTLSSSRGSSIDTLSPSTSTSNSLGKATFIVSSNYTGITQINASSGNASLDTSIQFFSDTSSLIANYSARLFDGSQAGTNSASTKANWANLISPGNNKGYLAGFDYNSSSGWNGNGTSTSPYNLTFLASSSDYVSFGRGLNTFTDFFFEMSVAPASVTTRGSVLLSNGDSWGRGFTLRQSKDGQGKLELVLGSTLSSYADVILSDSPKAYYRLGDRSTTKAYDSSGNSFHGTYSSSGVSVGGPGALTFDSDTAIQLNGTASYVVLPVNAFTQTTNSSVEAWFKINSAKYGGLILLNGNDPYPTAVTGGYRDLLYIDTNGYLRGTYYTTAGAALSSTTTVRDGKWHYSALTKAGNTQILYLDGVSQSISTATVSAAVTSANQYLYLGLGYNGSAGSYPGLPSNTYSVFPGQIDEVSLYYSTLSATQIANHYVARMNASCLSDSTLSNNNYYFISGVYESSTSVLSLFINGNEECSVLTNEDFVASSAPMAAGASYNNGTPPTTNYFSGSISDIRFYSTALDPTTQASDYNAVSGTNGSSTPGASNYKPTVSISSPSNGTVINSSNDSSSFQVTGSCDSQSTASIDIYVDNTDATSSSALCMGAVFSNTINTTTLSTGPHILTALLSTTSNTITSTPVLISRDLSDTTTARLALANFPSPQTAGAAGNFVLSALDSFGYIIPTYTGTVTFSSSDSLASLPAQYTFTSSDKGVHLFSATLNTHGVQSITATDNARGLIGTQSGINIYSSFVADWPFSYGTDSAYTFDSSLIRLNSSGVAQLLYGQTDSSGTDFGQGIGLGSSYSWGNSYYQISSNVNYAELDSSWAPAYSNLVGYWKLNGSGSIAEGDSVPAIIGPNLTAHNTNGTGLQYSGGKLSQAISFDGVDDYLSNDSTTMNVSGNFTVAAWAMLKANAGTGNHNIVGTQGGSGNAFSFGINSSSSIALNVGNGTSTFGSLASEVSSNLLPSSIFHHCVASVKSTAITVYFDGITVASGPISGGTPLLMDATHILTIGDNAIQGSNHFLGSIDEVAIWNTALTTAQVQALYQRQSPTYSAIFTSRMYSPINNALTQFIFQTELPYYKNLPANSSSETTSSYPSLTNNALMSGNVALWHFDENAGSTTFSDSSANANTGTAVGSLITGVTGKLGNAIGINGSSGIYVNVPHSASLALTSNLSILAWVYPTNFNAQSSILGKTIGSIPAPYDFYLQGTTGVPKLVMGNGSTYAMVNGNSAPTLGAWSMIAVTRNGSTGLVTHYLNGITNGSGTLSTTITDGGGALRIGSRDNLAIILKGYLDEVALWNRELSATEIQQIYLRGSNRIKYQLRSCNSNPCTTESWAGPNGTNQSYFSELYNTSNSTLTGDTKTTSASFNLSNFVGLSLGSKPYYQYRVILETENNWNSGMGPLLNAVSLNTNVTSSTITTNTAIPFSTLLGFNETLGSSGCSQGVYYQISKDKTLWYYVNSYGVWTIASGSSSAEASSASQVNSYASSFSAQVGSGVFYVRAILTTDNSGSSCNLDDIYLLGNAP